MSEVGTLPAESDEKEPEDKAGLDLLAMCRAEMQRAIGFDTDAELRDDRERALLYYKGDMSKDMPSLPNRSKAVSSDISDAVETILPDLIEIFIGGDDVVAFIPQKEADVEAAAQETAYLHKVAFQDNDGFINLNTALKDALLLKTGIFRWEWEEDKVEQVEEFTGKNAVEVQLASQDGQISDVEPGEVGADGQPTYSFKITKVKDRSSAKYYPVAPDDFAAAQDTIKIAETTYCCERQRPRIQDLIAQGFDAEKVRNLESYSYGDDQTIQQARDNAGENNSGTTPDNEEDEDGDLRQVEIRKHCIRILGDGGKLEYWCLYSNADASNEISREKIQGIPYAVGSPYLVPHRLIGRSVADLLIEVQKIKTALYRMCLDAGYFALNQRSEVAMDRANDFTIADLLRNEPLVPVRSKTGDAVRPLVAGPLNFDPYKAIEFFSTVAESRTGVVRNAQGLNPDTLHDTAKGAMMLLSAAQKRTKMIARVLAETLIKPLFLGLHSLIRENASAGSEAQLLGKWVAVDPTKWGERNAMTVEVGLGASGKDMEIAAMDRIIASMALIGKEQGGADGPIITWKNVYKAATDQAKKLGVKTPQDYYTDPSSPEGQQAMAAAANRPDPEVAKVQGEQALQKQKQDGEMQLGQMKVQNEKEIQANKSTMQAAADQHKQELEHQREVQKQADAMALEELRLASEERIAIQTAHIRAAGQIEAARIAAKASDGAQAEAREAAGE